MKSFFFTTEDGDLTSISNPPVEKIEKANPVAAELLRCCAFLHAEEVPEEVFGKGAPELGPVLEPLGSNSLSLRTPSTPGGRLRGAYQSMELRVSRGRAIRTW
jgi:hypothetical protein